MGYTFKNIWEYAFSKNTSNNNNNNVPSFDSILGELNIDANNVTLIASGSDGAIYSNKTNVSRVIKVARGTKSLLEHEYNTATFAAQYDIGPRIFTSKSGIYSVGKRHYLVMYMENMTFTLAQYLSNKSILKTSVQKNLKLINNLITKMHRVAKLCHNDLHPSNIMYSVRKKRWYIVDFASSRPFMSDCRDRLYLVENKKIFRGVRIVGRI